MEFLYADEDNCYFRNGETSEQHAIDRELAGPQAALLEPGMTLPVEFADGSPVSVLFPDIVEVRIAETAAAAHQQAAGTLKSAKVANGIEILVPQFIKEGDTIRLDARTFKYVERAHPEAKAKSV
jgi:elongation factor P